jgi:outer membrane protein OmpA-like peptidoglycan-associated protein
MRTFSAEPNEPTTFGTALIGNFFTKDPFLNGLKDSRNQFRVNGNYTFKLGIPIEVFAGFSFTYNDNSDSGAATTMTTYFENSDVGLRFGHSAFSDRFFLGGYAYGRALSGTRALRNTSGGTIQKGGPVMTGGAGFSETFDMSKVWTKFPIRQMLNIGYRGPNGNLVGATNDFNRFALDSYYFQALVPSISLELIYRWVSPFVEYSLEYAIMTKSPKPAFGDNRQKLTFGTRITPIRSFAILLAGDLGIGGPAADLATGIPRNPPYDIFVGVSFQTLGSKLNNDVGSVRGVVTDQATGSPLTDVNIEIVGEGLVPFKTDPSGSYSFDLLKNGNYQIKFEKPGYESSVRSFSVRDGGDSVVDASLAIAGPRSGSLEISVTDPEGKPISRAIVSVSGLEAGLATNESGKLQIKSLLEGSHSITAEASGYLAGSASVQISPEQLAQQSLVLQRAQPEDGLCSGSVKNAEGTPLTAVFSSEDGKTPPFGTDPVTGKFSQRLPQGSHEFKVRAENYLPQTVICNVTATDSGEISITLEKPKEAVVIDNKIVLPDAIYFEFGKASIKEESLGILDQVVSILLKNDNYQMLKVEGHTDNIGSQAYNQNLSEKRSAAVRLYLINKGVKASKISSKGFGKTKPIATNLTTEGRAENRRVEFNLVRNEP